MASNLHGIYVGNDKLVFSADGNTITHNGVKYTKGNGVKANNDGSITYKGDQYYQLSTDDSGDLEYQGNKYVTCPDYITISSGASVSGSGPNPEHTSGGYTFDVNSYEGDSSDQLSVQSASPSSYFVTDGRFGGTFGDQNQTTEEASSDYVIEIYRDDGIKEIYN